MNSIVCFLNSFVYYNIVFTKKTQLEKNPERKISDSTFVGRVIGNMAYFGWPCLCTRTKHYKFTFQLNSLF